MAGVLRDVVAMKCYSLQAMWAVMPVGVVLIAVCCFVRDLVADGRAVHARLCQVNVV
jgi:hypothetical protein